jgi:hypothetical protein
VISPADASAGKFEQNVVVSSAGFVGQEYRFDTS